MTLTFFEHLDVVAEVDVGEVLDDDVESLAADVLDHLLLVVLVVVVEDVVRAALGHHVHPVLGARRPDDRGSQSPAIEQGLIRLRLRRNQMLLSGRICQRSS